VKLARANTLLLIAIIVVNGYIAALPILPQLLFWIQSKDTHKMSVLQAKVESPPPKGTAKPTENRLIIPSMLLDEPINEGKTLATLRKGLWRLPHTSTPDTSSNTVIVGHRLTYSNPRGTLYNLDKVHVNDTLGLWWNGKQYIYSVTSTKVVHASEVSVEAPTDKAQLTLYTCTPLWLPKDRLVVTANLEKIYD
jgi:LPXTG-site transpeptidase (sortase) family protein